MDTIEISFGVDDQSEHASAGVMRDAIVLIPQFAGHADTPVERPRTAQLSH
jgi:hypothetical protein